MKLMTNNGYFLQIGMVKCILAFCFHLEQNSCLDGNHSQYFGCIRKFHNYILGNFAKTPHLYYCNVLYLRSKRKKSTRRSYSAIFLLQNTSQGFHPHDEFLRFNVNTIFVFINFINFISRKSSIFQLKNPRECFHGRENF